MDNHILIGQGRRVVTLARDEWERQVSRAPEVCKTRLSFMSDEHHLVRYFVVRELPRAGKPLGPDYISEQLKLPLSRIESILDDLEQNLFFLVRDGRGAVSWAYPVTVDPTPHRLAFSSGERLYAA